MGVYMTYIQYFQTVDDQHLEALFGGFNRKQPS